MGRTAKRLILALALGIVIVIVGTIGGFFNVSDVLNRVVISSQDNSFGGKTINKATTEDKVVSWTKNFNTAWIKPINDEKPYMLQEVLDQEDKVVQYRYAYLTEQKTDAVVTYYEEALKAHEVSINKVDDMTSIDVQINEYKVSFKVEPDTGKTEVTVLIDRQ